MTAPAKQGATSVRHSVTVGLPPEKAFELFTDRMDDWWPSDSHSVLEGPTVGTIEPFVGGRWYDRAEDGTECNIGTVLVWDPPARVVFAWRLTPAWEYEPDLQRCTEVDVTFAAEGAGTVVTLEHRGFESYGEPGAAMRDQVGADDGWPQLMRLYAAAA